MLKTKGSALYNSGLDAYCWIRGDQTILARTRLIRSGLGDGFYPTDTFDKATRRALRTAARIGLVQEFKTGFQFSSETAALKKLLQGPTVSISQKQFIYCSARPYRVGEAVSKHAPRTVKRLRDLSFAIIVLGFLDNTGQEKISARLGITRQTVNERCKKNPYLKTQQNWVRVTNLFGNQRASSAALKSALAQHNLNAMRVGDDGWLYRQIANRYWLRNIKIEFEDHKTFKISNKVLNRYFFTGVARSNCPVPANKYIAMLRTQRKNKRLDRDAHGTGLKKPRLRTALENNNEFYGERTDRFQVEAYFGPKMVEHTYRYLKTPYRKLHLELSLLLKHGLMLEHEPYNRKILNGTFKQVSTRGMHRHLKNLRDGSDKPAQDKAMGFLKNRNDYRSGTGRGLFQPMWSGFSNQQPG